MSWVQTDQTGLFAGVSKERPTDHSICFFFCKSSFIGTQPHSSLRYGLCCFLTALLAPQCGYSNSPERDHRAFKAPNHAMYVPLAFHRKSLPVPGLGQVPKPRLGVHWPAGPMYLFCGPLYAPNPNQTSSSCVATERPRGAPSTDPSAF